jgi:cytochrome b involved in lipid metabolism
MSEVEQHTPNTSSQLGLWSVIHDTVYYDDLTEYISKHPGGSGTIARIGGRGGTMDSASFRSW